MHSFQDFDFDQMEVNPFHLIGKDWMLVTAGDEEKANTMTASWGGMGVMWGKNVAFIFIRESRYTKEFIDREERFSLSFPDEKYKKEMKFLGAVSGRDEDKISEARIHIGYMEGIPYVDEGKMILLCKCLSKTELTEEDFLDLSIEEKFYENGDYHTMYIAEITGMYVR